MLAGKLMLQWSPGQIAGWLKQAYASDEDYHVSHETIYSSLYIQARGALKKGIVGALAAQSEHAPIMPHTKDRRPWQDQ
jgi:IS30 family transposase